MNSLAHRLRAIRDRDNARKGCPVAMARTIRNDALRAAHNAPTGRKQERQALAMRATHDALRAELGR